MTHTVGSKLFEDQTGHQSGRHVCLSLSLGDLDHLWQRFGCVTIASILPHLVLALGWIS